MTQPPTALPGSSGGATPRSRRVRWALEMARARALQLAAAAGITRRRTTYVWQRVAEHRSCWESAAAAIGAEFVPLSESVWEVRRGSRSTRIANDLVQLDDPVTLQVAGDKELSYRLAREAGVRVPEHVVFDRSELARARRWATAGQGPFVVKPASGTSSGIGVTVGVRTDSDLLRAVAYASVRSRRVILQRLVPGESCRLLYLDGELVHAVRRRGVRVTPDGHSSIERLLRAAGQGRVASARTTHAFLEAAGLTIASVLPVGPDVLVAGLPAGERQGAGLRTVYDEDITALVGSALAAEGARVVAAVGSAWAGVDVVTDDPGRPLAERGAFLEINTTPGILHHCPTGEGACRTAARVLERLLAVPA